MPDDFLGNLLDAYLTPAQLASELGVSVRSIHRWHALRQGPPRTQIGRRPMYRRDAVRLGWAATRKIRNRK